MELLKTVHAIPIGIDRILLFGIDSKTDSPVEFRVFDTRENTITFTYRLDKDDQEGVKLTGQTYPSSNGVIFTGSKDGKLSLMSFNIKDLTLSTTEELTSL